MTSSIRTPLAFALLTLFILYFFSAALTQTGRELWDRLALSSRQPDFSRYAPSPRTLSPTEFPVNQPHKRVLVFGDIHGMNEPFQALLEKLDYDPHSDTLVHVGDIIAKGPHRGSLAVLDFMASNNITGVRGNHDQKVIEWRSWLDWITRLDGGAVWLSNLHAAAEEADPDDPEQWAAKYLKHHSKKWAGKVPPGWSMLSDHYRLARDMTPRQFEYMLSLPLVLHAPEAHVLIAHAGVLPSDPRYKPSHRRQPLARVPSLHHLDQPTDDKDKTALLRRLQEAAILFEVPQNNDAWVTLNMRGILKDNSVTRSKEGTPWAELWNRDVGFCTGFDARHRYEPRSARTELPCFPATVVYGHAASRGLDVNRWSVGLDSGCVKERRLSALVLDGKTSLDGRDIDLETRKKHTIQFGQGSARIVDIKCSR